MTEFSSTDDLIEKYADLIEPHLELAKRAYGAKTQTTPAHVASREYTRLLVEFNENGGSLIKLAKRLGVSYSGVRRRVFTSNVPSVKSTRRQRSTIDQATIEDAVTRVNSAKSLGIEAYHHQLHDEYYSGIPMNVLAKALGISNAAPLYYAIQRHYKRTHEVA